VYEKFVGDDKVVIIEGCNNPKAVTLLLRAESKRTLDECHRSAIDAISVLKGFVREPRIVAGGGSSEAAMANAVRERGKFISGRSQLAIEKFAEALEEIPITLARNAGMNVIDTLAMLRSEHSKRNRDASAANYGIDVKRRRVANVFPYVIEPLVVKEQVLKSAVEVANLILRVDDVLMAKPALYTHTHDDGTQHSHKGGNKEHRHDYFDKLGKSQRPAHHYY
jgi:chaperonin GroEL (HSP60 family)